MEMENKSKKTIGMEAAMKQGGIFITAVITLILICTPGPGHARTPEIESGLNYLASTQNADGSWGAAASATDSMTATAEAIGAQRLINATSADLAGAINWLSTQKLDATAQLSRRILALASPGTDKDLLLSYSDSLYRAWGGYEGYDLNILDTALALRALGSIDYENRELLNYALGYLLDNQKLDGGWSFSKTDDRSNTYVTSNVLLALLKYRNDFYLEENLDRAVNFIRSKQNFDGGFGSSPSTAYETSLAMQGLITYGYQDKQALNGAANYLAVNQSANGSWDDDVYSTALALNALNQVKPNLSVSSDEIVLAKPALSYGEDGTLQAVVRNKGMADANNVVVRFYSISESHREQIGDDVVVPVIYSMGSEVITLYYQNTLTAGTQEILVKVDPDNNIMETDETDNEALKSQLVLKQIDLGMDPEVLYYPDEPMPFTELLIQCLAINYSEQTLGNVKVAVYEGNPLEDGVYLSETVLNEFGPLRKQFVQFTLSNQSIGAHRYYFWVDPENQFQESNEYNNIKMLEVIVKDPDEVSGNQNVDLYIMPENIFFNPPLPFPGENFTIKAIVHNSSSVHFSWRNPLAVSFYYEDINGNIVGLGWNFQKNIGGWWTKEFSVSAVMPDDAVRVYAKVDPQNQVIEDNENNNIAFKNVLHNRVDLAVTEKDINLEPALPEKGEQTSINITVRNNGSLAGSGLLRVYGRDPGADRELLGELDITVDGNSFAEYRFDGWAYPYASSSIEVELLDVAPVDFDDSNNSAIAVYGENISLKDISYQGKEFWISRPTIKNIMSNYSASIILQSEKLANVTIKSNGFVWNEIVEPGKPAVFGLLYYTEIYYRNKAENKGIHITSDQDISVIFKAPSYGATVDESYLAIPAKNLGTEYFNISTTSHSFSPYQPYGDYASLQRINVVATRDNTTIEIEGNRIKLNKGQSYQFQRFIITDFTGYYIRSDKPISVISGVDCTYIPQDCGVCDSLLAQIMPTSIWGREFLTAPLYSPASSDFIRIVSADDNTEINFQDEITSESIYLDKGQWIQVDVEGPTRISSDKPVEVAQYAKGYYCAGVGDPFEMLIIPTDMAIRDYPLYVPTGFDQNFVSVIAPEQNTEILLDGMSISPEWRAMPGSGSYALIDLTENSHRLKSNKPILAYSHGYREAGSYGHPAGYGILLPDLIVEKVNSDEAIPYIGQIYNLSFELENGGDKEASNVSVKAFLGEPGKGELLAEKIIEQIEAEEKKVIALEIDTRNFTEFNNIYIVADHDNHITEKKENNNMAFLTVEFSRPSKPDLVLENISLSEPYVESGKDVLIFATLKNRGSDTGQINIKIYENAPEQGQVIKEFLINETLSSNEEYPVTLNYETLNKGGQHTLYLVADPENNIDEYDENNNTAEIAFFVNEPELLISVSSDKNEYQSESEVLINLSVANNGKAVQSGTGNLFIADSEDNKIAHIATFNLDGLKPSGLSGWKYRILTTATFKRDIEDALIVADIAYDLIESELGLNAADINPDSFRVLETDQAGNINEQKNIISVTKMSTSFLLGWRADGMSYANIPRYFQIYLGEGDYTAVELHKLKNKIAYGSYNGVYIAEITTDSIFNEVYPVGFGSTNFEFGDFNNDGRADLIAIRGKSIYYYRSRETGTIDTRIHSGHQIASNYYSWTKMAIADFNNDGNNDFVTNHWAVNIDFYLFLGNGDGTFLDTRFTAPSENEHFDKKKAADVNNDGNMDLIVVNGPGKVYLLEGNGDGTFRSPRTLFYFHSGVDSLVVDDFNNDGNVDIITDTRLHRHFIFHGKGDGTFEAAEHLPELEDYKYYKKYDSIDINSDGFVDIIALDRDAFIYFLGKGDGSFENRAFAYQIGVPSGHFSVTPAPFKIQASITGQEEIKSAEYDFNWNTSNIYAGSYRIKAELMQNEVILAKAVSDFQILPDIDIESHIFTDKNTYVSNEMVRISSFIKNNGVNYILNPIHGRIIVLDSQNAILYSEEIEIGDVYPGQFYSYDANWNTDRHPEGIYTVKLEISGPNDYSATSEEHVEILGSSQTGEGILGSITAEPELVKKGGDVTLLYTITNRGNEDITGLAVRVLVVNPTTQAVEQTLETAVDLPRGTTVTGSFVASTSGLSPDAYLAILQVSTPEIAEPKTLAGDTFEVKAPTAEVTKAVVDVKNVLVWLNYPWQSGRDCPDVALIENALRDAGVNYHIVYGKKDFQGELRNPLYTDYMIMGDHHPLEDHYAASLKEKVFSGRGFISSMFNRHNLDADVFGVKFTGYLNHGDYPVELMESDISSEYDFETRGRALRVEAIDPVENIGWIVKTTRKDTETHPALIQRSYGMGNVLFYAFDLGLSTGDYERFESLVVNSLNYIHSARDSEGAFHPYQLVPVEVRLKSLGEALDVRVKETYPPEFSLFDPETKQWIMENPWVVDIHLGAEEIKSIHFYALTPDMTGTFTLTSTVGYVEDGTYNHILDSDVELSVQSIDEMTVEVLDALNSLSVPVEEQALVLDAGMHIQNTRSRAILTTADIDENITDILQAVDSLLDVTSADASEIVLMLNGLLEAWEGRWYFEE